MLQRLIAHSSDLKRLKDEGYGIQVKSNLLLAHRIPYLNAKKEIEFGTLVSELTLATANKTGPPSTHVIFFIGGYPHNVNSSPITALRHQDVIQEPATGIKVSRSFSNKPGRNYYDYFEKIATYADIISAPAKVIDPDVTEKNFLEFPEHADDSVFQYLDTNASRANIVAITEKLAGQKVGIIGVGGTGSYILDFVAKTPVSEIHLFDGDRFHTHNAFRAPGAASIEDLNAAYFKVTYLAQKYRQMHKHVFDHPFFITEETLDALKNLSFVFIAIDKGEMKKVLIDYLLKNGIPFIDAGLGIEEKKGSLMGMVRVTTGTPQKHDHLAARISFVDDEDDDYNSNIQIAELNALNATLAVIKWKKMFGFYNDLEGEFHTTYTINVSQMVNDEITL